MVLRIAEQAGLTDVGRQRHTNEDSFLASSPVFAVADGMGGARAGEVASKMAVDEFSDDDSGTGAESRLADIAARANRRIFELAQRDESRAGMGTTLTSAIVGPSEISIGHVGDSRAYRWRGGELEQLTRDHSLVAELERKGELAPGDAERHPQKNIITRALGPEPEVEVDTHTHPARAGDVYLLCSDGLTTMVSEERTADILRAAPSLEDAARQLVDEANRRGGKDNTTVVLFRLEEDSEAPAESKAPADSDTLVGVEADEVGDAVAAAEAADAAEQPAAAREGASDELDSTRLARPGSSGSRPVAVPPARRRKRLARRAMRVAVPLLVAAAVVGGLYFGSRQIYFLGTNDAGVVTVYRGLPYELPLGIELYSEDYASSVPARSIPPKLRGRVLDHELRSRGDAEDLTRQVERERLDRSTGR